MISAYIDIIIAYLNTHSVFLIDFLPILVFLSALLESSPGLGTITPGTLFLLFFGFLSANLNMNVSIMILSATLGSVTGDILGYFLGKYGTYFLLKHKKILKHSHIEEGHRFFSNHGFKSIFIGRFIGPIRPIIPLIAGSIKMRISKFLFYDIASAFAWSFLYIIVGYYFGNHFREIEKFVSSVSILTTLIIVIFVALYYFKFKNNKNDKK